MQHPPDNGYYNRNRRRMVKKMGTIFEKNMNPHSEVDRNTERYDRQRKSGLIAGCSRDYNKDRSSRSISSRAARPREKAVALPAAVPSRRA